jgi:hypothetical protein
MSPVHRDIPIPGLVSPAQLAEQIRAKVVDPASVDPAKWVAYFRTLGSEARFQAQQLGAFKQDFARWEKEYDAQQAEARHRARQDAAVARTKHRAERVELERGRLKELRDEVRGLKDPKFAGDAWGGDQAEVERRDALRTDLARLERSRDYLLLTEFQLARQP